MNIKIHDAGDREVIALCDKELIGKKFENDVVSLDLSSKFYDGEDLGKEEVIEILKGSKNINIVGKESVKVAIEAGVIDEYNVRKVEGIPYAISTGA